MNPSPITGNTKQSVKELNNLMQKHDISAVPILDENSKIVDLEISNTGISSQKKVYDNPVFLMAGGLGTRLQPLTDDSPKPMLQVGGKPLLEIILKNFIEHGFVNFYISVQYLPEIRSSRISPSRSPRFSYYCHEWRHINFCRFPSTIGLSQ
jgi:hypothetical protein